MIIHAKQNWVYLGAPKTGCRSFHRLFSRLGGRSHGAFHDNRIPSSMTNPTVIGIHRNPYERLVSWWWFWCREPSRHAIRSRHGQLHVEAWDLAQFLRFLIKTKFERPPMSRSFAPGQNGSQAQFYPFNATMIPLVEAQPRLRRLAELPSDLIVPHIHESSAWRQFDFPQLWTPECVALANVHSALEDCSRYEYPFMESDYDIDADFEDLSKDWPDKKVSMSDDEIIRTLLSPQQQAELRELAHSYEKEQRS